MWKANIPTSMIGEHFGVNRVTILGVAYRNRDLFPMKGKKQKLAMRSTPRQRVEKVRRDVEAFHGETLPEVLPNEYDFGRLPDAKTLMDLDRGECKWPVNKGSPFMFCAAEAEGNYCNHHFIRSRRAA
jgi:GcrA cell cycle regulator